MVRGWLVICCACGRLDFDAARDAAPHTPISIIVGGSGVDGAEAIAIDAADNLYVAGYFAATVDFGAGPVTSRGGRDGFVASYDRSGLLRWVRTFGSQGTDFAEAVVVLPGGDVLVGGHLEGTVDFGGGPVTPSGTDDAFSWLMTASGDFISATAYGGADVQITYGNDFGTTIAVGPDGRVFIGGVFVGTGDLGAGAITSIGSGTNGFVVAPAMFGGPAWSFRFGITRLNEVKAVASDTASVYVAGYYEGAPDLGAGPLPSAQLQDAVVTRLDAATGAVRWARAFGGPSFDYATAIDVANDGTVFAVGFFDASADFGSGVVTARGRDAFLVALSNDGAPRFAVPFGSPGCEQARMVLVEDELVWVGGSFEMTLDVLGTTIDAAPGGDAFLVAFSHAGALREVIRIGESGNDLITGAVRTSRGTMVVAGSTHGVPECLGGEDGGAEDIWILEL